ncbi:hypothetical protein SteCoe_29699 [Stentor coeruleus]|uniref:Uncharacterized protein n=1 Tax=Stentor coeruleus TaxID=5963 RepID=A0A1R2B5L8_9CILI|nr:hypothetical protein SteCoe_29699 [Stentor coeruleus]
MAHQPDWSIQTRVRQDIKYTDAEAYARKMQDIAKTSTWHERQQKFEVARDNIRAEERGNFELQLANRELKERRRCRLRELLQSEAFQYEQELAKRGLAIYRDKL